MPRGSAQRRPAPQPLEIRRFETPRPANDRASPNNMDRGGDAPKSFGRKQPQPLQDAADEAMRRGTALGLSLLLRGLIPHPLRVGLDGLEYLDSLVKTAVYPSVTTPGTGWILVNECKAIGGGEQWFQLSAYPGPGSLAAVCLGGQAGQITTPENSISPLDQSGLTWGKWNVDQSRYTHIRNYGRIRPRTEQWSRTFIVSHPFMRAKNPNVWRFVNPTPQPLSRPVPRQAPASNRHRIVEIAPRPQNRPAPQTARAARSKPPPARTKEVKGKAGKLAAEMFNVLDKLSEAAEVVDSFYQALPKDVRKRWNRPERPGDQMGQYGAEGADWKLQALYHNWEKVNMNEAIKNVLANQLEDKLYGEAHRAKDRLTFRGRKRPRRTIG